MASDNWWREPAAPTSIRYKEAHYSQAKCTIFVVRTLHCRHAFCIVPARNLPGPVEFHLRPELSLFGRYSAYYSNQPHKLISHSCGLDCNQVLIRYCDRMKCSCGTVFLLVRVEAQYALLHTGGITYSIAGNKISYDTMHHDTPKSHNLLQHGSIQQPSPLPFQSHLVAAYIAAFATSPGQHSHRRCTNIL